MAWDQPREEHEEGNEHTQTGKDTGAGNDGDTGVRGDGEAGGQDVGSRDAGSGTGRQDAAADHPTDHPGPAPYPAQGPPAPSPYPAQGSPTGTAPSTGQEPQESPTAAAQGSPTAGPGPMPPAPDPAFSAPYGAPFGAPPPPPHPPVGPGFPGGPVPPLPPEPSAPADPLRAVAVALLNLTGLGLGYALTRRWFAMAVCWAATAVLLFAALPADPDGAPRNIVIAYLAFLALAAAHGAYRGLRTRLSWPPAAPVAAVLGLVLLAVPAGGVVLYDNARDEAIEQALLHRLDEADRLVQAAKNQPFNAAQPDFDHAMATYHDLDSEHAGSRAGKRVPESLKKYYTAVAAPYDQKKYCDAVEPLTYLRKVPDQFGRQRLGTLAGWPDDRLATSLYECGIDDLGSGQGSDTDTATGTDTDTENGDLAQLLKTFPQSPQAAKVEPALGDMIDAAAKDLGGSDPCPANERLQTLGDQASALPGDAAGIAEALSKDADRADGKVQSGTYACGVDQYKDKDFAEALDTLNHYLGTYKHAKNRDRAKKIAIAAEIAKSVPAAGRHLPGSGSGGSISVTVSNDSPDEIEILYTGPVTGSFKLPACDGCSTYSSEAAASVSACKASGRHYPSRTIRLPVGTTYFLHKSTDTSASVGTDTARIEPGYTYTECAYVVKSFGSGYSS